MERGPASGERLPVPCVASRKDTVEHVDAGAHREHQVARRADSHQVPGALWVEHGCDLVQRLVHALRRFAHREAAEREAVEREGSQFVRVRTPQIGEASALHDAEERLPRRPPCGEGPFRPTRRAEDRLFHGRARSASAEGHTSSCICTSAPMSP